MAYTDEVWNRARSQFSNPTLMKAWLDSFERPKKGANAYTRSAVQVRDDYVLSTSISDDLAPKARNFREIANLEKQANAISIDEIKSPALGAINERIRILDGEAEVLANQFKNAETVNQRETAESKLRELSPQSLGGIKSGEKRRAASAFRSVLG
jgi:hypothetical protein